MHCFRSTILGGFCSFTKPSSIRRGWIANVGGVGILGVASADVSVATGRRELFDDRITVTILGYQYQLITLGWAGTYNGKTIIGSIPVEN
jgi:hypothetical protein